MKCLLLASQINNAFSSYHEAFPLIELMGMPLIERSLRGAKIAGIDDCVVVTAEDQPTVRQFVDGLSSELELNITHIANPKPEKGEVHAALLAKSELKGRFVLFDVASQFQPDSLQTLAEHKGAKDSLQISVDSDTIHQRLDLIDVVRVHSSEGNVRAIGKGLAEFDSFATGLYQCGESFFKALTSVSKKANATLVDAVKHLVKEDAVQVVDIDGAFWSEVDTPEALLHAEQNRVHNLRHQRGDNPVMKYFFRPMSTRLTQFLVGTWFNVRHLSLMGFILSLLASLLFGTSDYSGLFFGAILSILAVTLHISSREVGKMIYQFTPFNRWFDGVMSQYGEIALLTGLTVSVVPSGSKNLILVGLLAVAGCMMLHFSADKFSKLMGKPAPIDVDVVVHREIRYLIIAIGAIIALPTLVLLVAAIFYNVVVIRRLVVWKKQQ